MNMTMNMMAQCIRNIRCVYQRTYRLLVKDSHTQTYIVVSVTVSLSLSLSLSLSSFFTILFA